MNYLIHAKLLADNKDFKDVVLCPFSSSGCGDNWSKGWQIIATQIDHDLPYTKSYQLKENCNISLQGQQGPIHFKKNVIPQIQFKITPQGCRGDYARAIKMDSSSGIQIEKIPCS